jgi:hypothetical protein
MIPCRRANAAQLTCKSVPQSTQAVLSPERTSHLSVEFWIHQSRWTVRPSFITGQRSAIHDSPTRLTKELVDVCETSRKRGTRPSLELETPGCPLQNKCLLDPRWHVCDFVLEGTLLLSTMHAFDTNYGLCCLRTRRLADGRVCNILRCLITSEWRFSPYLLKWLVYMIPRILWVPARRANWSWVPGKGAPDQRILDFIIHKTQALLKYDDSPCAPPIRGLPKSDIWAC